MRRIIAMLLLTLGQATFSGIVAAEEIAVIANPEASINALSTDDVMRIFLVKTNSFPDQQTAIPVSHKEGSMIRMPFDEKVLNRSLQRIKAY